jgi:hypothetical protein
MKRMIETEVSGFYVGSEEPPSLPHPRGIVGRAKGQTGSKTLQGYGLAPGGFSLKTATRTTIGKVPGV